MFRQLILIWLVLLVAALSVVTSLTRFIEKCRLPHGFSKPRESTASVTPTGQAILKQLIQPTQRLK
jgi:hypothetical protein